MGKGNRTRKKEVKKPKQDKKAGTEKSEEVASVLRAPLVVIPVGLV